ncbi:hypothetical protein [Alteromonas ponticola]|uniref:Outer membrane lipoprotein-sorting protein n=1 Tax=Alteromonas ponticola TaxID=2720613 RepID=A0ABX1R4P5_9ALTE|nr:hypothetical protein [Alteromonas ponticola]NMH60743.1 hypothetical protein [Alteromonas ponticola]
MLKQTGFLLTLLFILGGCAQTSPSQETYITQPADGMSADAIFRATFAQHGGDLLAGLNDVNVAVDGEWHYLITKIQPLVTDEEYRQQSQERVLVSPRAYAVHYTGEAGTKWVYRTAEQTQVAYNQQQISDQQKIAATALTADAFYLFVLGPLGLSDRVTNWKRLDDKTWKEKAYYRINGQLSPGIGLSERDHITLWVDKETNLTFRLHITLEGFEATKGAHVDTTFLAYESVGQFILPTHFFERVLGPIKLDAHEWWYTGIDINRGLSKEDISIDGWSDNAAKPAKSLDDVRQ